MRVLLDLNVLIDVALRWKQFPDSLALYNKIVTSQDHEGIFPACGFTTLYYVLKQEISEVKTRFFLTNFQRRLRFGSFTEKTVKAAHLLQMKDLEDACIAATAMEVGCGVIATRNVADYVSSPVPAKSPTELLRVF